MKPLHRAVGAKNWMAEPKHRRLWPDWSTVRRFREPFFFSGAVFWQIVVESEAGRNGQLPAVLGDSNPFVCDLLVALRDHPLELLAQIAARPSSEETFFAARERLNAWRKRHRDMEPACLVPRAADFLALMVLGFNGLWRVNQDGDVNVPIGRTASGKPAKMPSGDVIWKAHRALARHRAEVRAGDFAEQLADVERGDVIFADPPYVKGFTGYSADGKGFSATSSEEQGSLFGEKAMLPTAGDLVRLRDALVRADRLGALFITTNLDTPTVRALFDGFNIQRVDVRHSVSCDAETRGQVGELVIRNFGEGR